LKNLLSSRQLITLIINRMHLNFQQHLVYVKDFQKLRSTFQLLFIGIFISNLTFAQDSSIFDIVWGEKIETEIEYEIFRTVHLNESGESYHLFTKGKYLKLVKFNRNGEFINDCLVIDKRDKLKYQDLIIFQNKPILITSYLDRSGGTNTYYYQFLDFENMKLTGERSEMIKLKSEQKKSKIKRFTLEQAMNIGEYLPIQSEYTDMTPIMGSLKISRIDKCYRRFSPDGATMILLLHDAYMDSSLIKRTHTITCRINGDDLQICKSTMIVKNHDLAEFTCTDNGKPVLAYIDDNNVTVNLFDQSGELSNSQNFEIAEKVLISPLLCFKNNELIIAAFYSHDRYKWTDGVLLKKYNYLTQELSSCLDYSFTIDFHLDKYSKEERDSIIKDMQEGKPFKREFRPRLMNILFHSTGDITLVAEKISKTDDWGGISYKLGDIVLIRLSKDSELEWIKSIEKNHRKEILSPDEAIFLKMMDSSKKEATKYASFGLIQRDTILYFFLHGNNAWVESNSLQSGDVTINPKIGSFVYIIKLEEDGSQTQDLFIIPQEEKVRFNPVNIFDSGSNETVILSKISYNMKLAYIRLH